MPADSDVRAPAIRFSGFKDWWTTAPMSEFLDFKNGYNAGKEQYGAGEKFINVLDIIDNDFITHDRIVGRVDLSREDFKKNEVRCGDLLFQRSSETREEVGQANVYLDEDRSATFGGFVIRGRPVAEFDSPFFNVMLKSARPRREIASRSGGSTRYNVGQDALAEVLVTIAPDQSEQEKIASLWMSLDQLIGLHRQKHRKLLTLKQAMLQKMFPRDGATNPTVRFDGFNGDWLRRKLEDSTVPVSSNTLSRSDLNYDSGLAKNIHYGDILVRFGSILNVNRHDIPFITDTGSANTPQLCPLQNGDIVIADAAEDRTVGKCVEVNGVSDFPVVAGLHTIAVRPTLPFAPFYLGYFLNSSSYRQQLIPIMQGTKVLSLSRTALRHTELRYPGDPREQEKIGSYFHRFDRLIVAHAIQVEKLQSLRTAFLEKMFV